ncbi:kelch repeat-containing protein [Polyangium fumosum]|uniref:Kelch repeat-containing protein n=1 Tax=Polyangium fumosum TaxID=889272 RepID=A0A4U1JE70_9BACT|nr:kelch repeat-containing protein [Polyangium fumosum]TKD09257.1 kelch repeat-containing protein [Polyangium fumosum]
MSQRRASLALASTLLAALAVSSVTSCVLIAEIDYDLIPEDTDAPDAGSGGGAPDSGSDAGCTSDTACDDQNPCTADACTNGACVTTPLAIGTTCGTPAPCVESLTCDAAGACAPKPVTTDDGDPCTTDACDPQTGAISHTAVGGACLAWVPLSQENAPSPRFNHTAIWTGKHMIIWGGERSGPDPLLGDGARYDPTAKTWTPMSSVNAPSPRFGHTAVWTGQVMMVWGGYSTNGMVGSGAIYNPDTDTWTTIPTMNEPTPRIRHSAVAAGAYMIVWGGTSGNNQPLLSGGRYHIPTKTWSPTTTMGAPSPRTQHSATWVGDRMVVWGGMDFFDWLGDGAMYSPLDNAWTAKTSMTNAASFRESHTAVWTGSEIYIWGGWNGGPYLDTGAIFAPQTGAQGTWTPMTTTGAPSPRRSHVAVWTGSSMIVWGGCGDLVCTGSLGDGGRYTPGMNGGTWEPIPEVPALSTRRDATAVWTGSRILVWGGRDAAGALGTGAEAQP